MRAATCMHECTPGMYTAVPPPLVAARSFFLLAMHGNCLLLTDPLCSFALFLRFKYSIQSSDGGTTRHIVTEDLEDGEKDR